MKQVTRIQKKVAISLSSTFTEGKKKPSEPMPEVTGILITQIPTNNFRNGRIIKSLYNQLKDLIMVTGKAT